MFELIKNKWDEIILFMKDAFEYNELSYKTWLLPLKPLKLTDDCLYIIASDNPMIVKIVAKKFKDPLSISIEKLTDLKITPVFITESEASNLPEHEVKERALPPKARILMS